MSEIELGDKVREKVSGMVGIVTGLTEWLYGCTTVTVQPQELKDGKRVDSSAFDLFALELIAKCACEPLAKPIQTGGPAPHDPIR
jgi:hypothetical protein